MLRDKDAIVVSNCILALNEILADEGGIAVNQAIIYHLLNRLKDFNEWTTCVILETAGKYAPTEDEVYDMLVRGSLWRFNCFISQSWFSSLKEYLG